MICVEKIQNLSCKLRQKSLLSKIFRTHQGIPYRSKVIVKTATEDDFSLYFQGDLVSWITTH